jgi:hypothetical protein
MEDKQETSKNKIATKYSLANISNLIIDAQYYAGK